MDKLSYTVELTRHPGEKWGLRLNGSEEPGRKVVISEIRQDGAAARCVHVCACVCKHVMPFECVTLCQNGGTASWGLPGLHQRGQSG